MANAAPLQAEPSILSYPFDGDTAPTAVDRVLLCKTALDGRDFLSAVGAVGAQSVQGARVTLGVSVAIPEARAGGDVPLPNSHAA